MQDRPDEIQFKVSEHDKSGDYDYEDQVFPVAIREIKGRRHTQEDFVTIALFSPDYAGLSADHWRDGIQQSIDIFHSPTLSYFTPKEIMQLSFAIRRMGSCFCANIITGDTIHTANLGDSTSFLIECGQGGETSIKRMNQLHNPREPRENTLLAQSFLINGGFLSRGRMDDRLAISRAIGDGDILARYDYAHTLDFSTHTFSKDAEVFVVTACDGLTEENKDGDPALTKEDIALIVNTFKSSGLTEIANRLVLAARYHFSGNEAVKKALLAGESLDAFSLLEGTGDNVSVVVTKINPHDDSVKCIAVLDGHAGDFVSRFVAEHFIGLLSSQVAHLLKTVARNII